MDATLPRRPDILDVLRRWPAEGTRSVVALEDRTRSVDYAELAARVAALAEVLVQLGVQNGDRVAVALPNSAASVEVFLACVSLGAIWVGINPSAPEAEASRQRDVVAPRLVITSEVIASMADAASGGSATPLPRPDRNAPCAIAFTSGTTGTPKAIVHSRSGISLVAASLAAVSVERTDRVGVILPLSIHNVMIVGPLATLMAGATTVVLDRLNARSVASACRERGLTLVRALVPATVYDLVHDGDITPDGLHSLREASCGAAGLAEDLRDAFETKFGVRLVGSYGLSEAPAVVCHENTMLSRRPGSSGIPLPHVSISVRDSAGGPVSSGVEGDLWVGPATDGVWANQYRPALGTWIDGGLRAADPTAHSFCTGDVGSVDSTGALHVSARRANAITRGGVTVNAAEIETVLGAFDGVREVAVVGHAHPRLGERIVAFVEVQTGRTVDAESLAADAAMVLSHGRVPDQFVLVETLPRNAMGKVSRPSLADMLSQDGMRE